MSCVQNCTYTKKDKFLYLFGIHSDVLIAYERNCQFVTNDMISKSR